MSKNYFYLILLIILTVIIKVNYSEAQNCSQTEIDSLILKSDHTEDIKGKITIYIQLAKCYRKKNIDSASYYTDIAYSLSKESDFKKGMAISKSIEGKIKDSQGQFDDALISYKESLELFQDQEKNVDYLSTINHIGIIYDYRHDYDNSLYYYQEGLREAELLNNKKYMAFFYNNLSYVYRFTGKSELELINYKKASILFRELGEEKYYSYTLLNIGSFYRNLKEYDTAIVYFEQSEKLMKRDNNYYGLTNLYLNLGEISVDKSEFNEAIKYFNSALTHAKLIDSLDPDRNSRISVCHIRTGSTYLNLGNYKLAKKHLISAQTIGENYNSLFNEKEINYGLFKCYFDDDQKDSALIFLDLFLAYNDSLQAEVYNEKIDSLNYEFQLQTDRLKMAKDKEIIILEKNRKELIYFTLIIIFIVISVIALLVWYLQKIKLQQSELKRLNLRLEKENLTADIEKKNRELTSTVLNLIERNEFITKISDSLKNIQSENKDNNGDDLEKIIKSLDKESINKLWKEFEIRYMEVHNDFHDKLTSQFPNLSANERRLCAFIVLDLSTKDISSITYQSLHSIKIARYRLRKKLGLDKNENLTIFLNNL